MSDIISPSKAGIAEVGFSTTQSDSLVFSPQWRTKKTSNISMSCLVNPVFAVLIYIYIYLYIYLSSISGVCLGKNPSKFISLRIL